MHMLTDKLVFREADGGRAVDIFIPPVIRCLGTLTVADLCAMYDALTMHKVYDKLPEDVRKKTEGILLIPSYAR